MRIRHFRQEDLPTLLQIERQARAADGRVMPPEVDFISWLLDPALDAPANAFVITDDDDELNTWGQAGTLEGIEGEIVGYTVVSLHVDEQGYHLLCQGSVHPQFRRQHAGRALLICALNRARIQAADFEFEAEQEGQPIYFEALLPLKDPGAEKLALKCEMKPCNLLPTAGLQLYSREL